MQNPSAIDTSFTTTRESLRGMAAIVAYPHDLSPAVAVTRPRAIFWRKDGKVTIQGARTVTIPEPLAFIALDDYGQMHTRDGAF